MTQYDLIAEDVAEVDPQLVVPGRDGEIMAVHYEQTNNMLLNEFVKAHKHIEVQEATIADLKSIVAQQQKAMESLSAQVKKVSAQLERSKPAPQTVLNNQ